MKILKWLLILTFVPASYAQAATHSITVAWDASTTSGVTYSVKRSAVSGGPYTTVVAGFSGLAYTDSGLAPQTNFCYIATAVLAGVESVNSNEACGTTLADPVVPVAPKNTRIQGVK